MPQPSNADDPGTEQQPPQPEGEQNALFQWAEDQPIAPNQQEAEPTGQQAGQPSDDEAEVPRKDSGSEASREPVEEPTDESDSEQEVSASEKKRFEYWQSQHDKVKNELDQYKTQYGDMPDEVISLARNIVRNPDLLDVVEGALTGDAQPARAPSAEQEQAKGALEPPTRPQKPSGYDHYEALNDPESESHKYLAAMQDYEESLSDYLLQKEQRREQEIAERRKQTEQQQAEQEARQQMARSLKDGYGMNSQQINEFFEVVSETPELDDLVKYYRVKSGIPVQPAESEQRKRELEARKQRSRNSPPPTGTGASASKPPEPGGAEGPFVYTS